MSLLQGRHRVLVQLRRPVVTDYGMSYVADGPPVAVACTVRMLSTSESTLLGLEATATIRVLARWWPGDTRSLVEWQDQFWEPRGLPVVRDGSTRTAHFEVTLVRVSADGDPV